MKEISRQVPKAKQKPLFGNLMELIRANTYRKFGAVVVTRLTTDMISDEDKKLWQINAYSIAGRLAAHEVDQWMAQQPRMKYSPEYVFEKGDIGSGMLRDAMVPDGLPEPIFRPGKLPEKTQSGLVVQPFVPL